jgi:hypothetical protein
MLKSTLIAVLAFLPIAASAQTRPAPPPPQTPKQGTPTKPAPTSTAQTKAPARSNSSPIRVRGFAAFGGVTFQAQESFDAVLGGHSGTLFGGGGQVLLPWSTYAEVGVSRFTRSGERVFVGPNQQVFPLGIPVDVTVTPLEITGGWRYQHCPRPVTAKPPAKGAKPAPQAPARPLTCAPKLVPYVGAGYSAYQYTESSEFSTPDEEVNDWFSGFHLLGGAEYQVVRWLAIAGEIGWSTIPDALGAGGVSAAFDEDNLGGVIWRLKVVVGRSR